MDTETKVLIGGGVIVVGIGLYAFVSAINNSATTALTAAQVQQQNTSSSSNPLTDIFNGIVQGAAAAFRSNGTATGAPRAVTGYRVVDGVQHVVYSNGDIGGTYEQYRQEYNTYVSTHPGSGSPIV